MEELNINELYQTQRTKQINRLTFFKQILKKCHHRIQTVSKKAETYCFFIVPEFVFGVPLFNVYQCSQFIIDNLSKSGFYVIYVRPNIIYISWDLRQYLTIEQKKQLNNIPQTYNIPQNLPRIEFNYPNQTNQSNEQKKIVIPNYYSNSNTVSNNQTQNQSIKQINNNYNNNNNNNKIKYNPEIKSTKDYKPKGRIIL